eukprot:4414056-Prymnesium_polylepis.1
MPLSGSLAVHTEDTSICVSEHACTRVARACDAAMAPRVLDVPLRAIGGPKVSRPAHLRLSTAD